MKNYIERLSTGYAHVNVSIMIWDALLTKRYKEKNDLYLVWSLSVLTVLLRDEGLMPQFKRGEVHKERKPINSDYCKNVYDLVKLLENKAATHVHEYEFFKNFKALFTENS